MKFISVEEAGKKFNLSARSIRNYCAQGRIPGAVLKGKTWLIPENASKPDRLSSKEDEALENLKYGEALSSFINDSFNSFYAIDNIRKVLLKKGYVEIKENEQYSFASNDKVFIVRNNSTLIALNIGDSVSSSNVNFHVIASHADSPYFKIKPESESRTDRYHQINVAPYGGLIVPSWLDRPLGVAGRVIIKNEDNVESRLVDLKDFTLLIPNVCIHFNRSINSGYEYNMAVDAQPFYSAEETYSSLKERIAKELKINKEDILNYDLFLYNKQNGVVWGEKKEFISSARLDDLMCVYTSLEAFASTDNEKSINVLYVADNEEVGSLSRQGANSDFLKSIFKRVCSSFNSDYEVAVAKSFLVSADNAHAVHPNKPGLTDNDNKAYMNKGIAIKFNAANSYTSDSISSAIFQKLCENGNVPYQFFTNRSDMRGGSTLGNYLLSQVSMMAVDIGLAQLAMHSSYETAGTRDIKYAIDAFKEFYSSSIAFDGNNYKITK